MIVHARFLLLISARIWHASSYKPSFGWRLRACIEDGERRPSRGNSRRRLPCPSPSRNGWCRLQSTTRNISAEPSADPAGVKREQNDQFLARFHEDMRHVVDTRRHLLNPLRERSKNRQERPVLLDEKSLDLDGAQRVYSMLQHLISIGQATVESFEIVLEVYIQRDRIRWRTRPSSSSDASFTICAADQAEELWNLLLETGRSHRNIPESTYDLVLQAYANCATPRGGKRYASRAMELYERLESVHGERPKSLTHVIHAYAWEQANMNTGQSALQAQSLLCRIDDDLELEDRMQCYDWVLEAWSKSGTAGSAENAQALFEKMKRLNETLEGSSVLDSDTYSNAILAWSKSNASDASSKCNQLLMELLDKFQSGSLAESEPPLIAFNGVITAFGRERRPAEAEKILDLMQRLRHTCKSLTPDAISYNSVLHAYLRSTYPSDEILDKALNLVSYMEEKSGEQPAITPNCFTYTTLLKCWLQSGRDGSAGQAEALLHKVDHAWKRGDRSVTPNNRVFNMVIHANAKSELRWPPSKAVELLNRMKASTLIQPDAISYTSALQCLSKSADPEAPLRAQNLLDELTAKYKATEDPDLMPNSRTFTMAILTFAKNHGDVVEARRLLNQLTDLYETTLDPQLRPTEYPYNYVLNCAANAHTDQQRAFTVAAKTFQDMRKSQLVTPDSFTYAFWIKCCNNLIPNGDLRTKCVSFAFQECRKGGLVTNEVLTRLFQGSPPRIVDQLLELPRSGTSYRTLTVRDLPPSWSRNASKRRA